LHRAAELALEVLRAREVVGVCVCVQNPLDTQRVLGDELQQLVARFA
jgi:hypothetical protein